MTTTTKKNTTTSKTAAPSHNVKFKIVKPTGHGDIKALLHKPTLAELVSGKGDAVTAAVAARVGAVATELKTDARAMNDAANVLEKTAKKVAAPAKVKNVVNNEATRAANAPVKKGNKAADAKAVKTAAKKAKRVTVASFMRELIEAGKANDEIFTAAQKRFPELDDAKKWYPAWYRGDMRRKAERAAAETAKKGGKKVAAKKTAKA